MERKSKRKGFDWSSCSFRHVAIKFAYLGWDYHGLALQANELLTVERELLNAMAKCCLIPEEATKEPRKVGWSRCGRTDKGVSSFGQVVSLWVRSKVPKTELEASNGDPTLLLSLPADADVIDSEPETKRQRIDDDMADVDTNGYFERTPSVPWSPGGRQDSVLGLDKELDYAYLLNRILSPNIRILGWTPVPKTFDARFSCGQRTYRYFFPNTRDLDLEVMASAAQLLVGEFDFRNFCKADVRQTTHFRRRIVSCSIVSTGSDGRPLPWAYIEVVGTAFLWHQIRCTATILLRIGKALESPTLISQLLDLSATPAKPAYNPAAPEPLVLWHCAFPGWIDDDTDWIGEVQRGDAHKASTKFSTWDEFESNAFMLSLKSTLTNLLGDLRFHERRIPYERVEYYDKKGPIVEKRQKEASVEDRRKKYGIADPDAA